MILCEAGIDFQSLFVLPDRTVFVAEIKRDFTKAVPGVCGFGKQLRIQFQQVFRAIQIAGKHCRITSCIDAGLDGIFGFRITSLCVKKVTYLGGDVLGVECCVDLFIKRRQYPVTMPEIGPTLLKL